MATAHLISNQPPDPFQAFALHIDDLVEQAQQYLDGEPVQNDAQAEDVSRLLNMLRKAGNDADDARKAEKKPHDDAAKAVQVRWKPLLDRIDLAATTAKQALTPFLTAKEAAQRAAADAARMEAQRLAEAAAQAAEQANPNDLAGQMTVKVLKENAIAAETAAGRLDKGRAQARGGERAVSLRSAWTPTLTDPVAALKHYRERQPDELRAWLLGQAEKDVRNGARAIPGFEISEARVAV